MLPALRRQYTAARWSARSRWAAACPRRHLPAMSAERIRGGEPEAWPLKRVHRGYRGCAVATRPLRCVGWQIHRAYGSAFALLPLYVEADHAILVTYRHNGEIAIDVELCLNDLLCCLRRIGYVGQRHLIRDLLLNG